MRGTFAITSGLCATMAAATATLCSAWQTGSVSLGKPQLSGLYAATSSRSHGGHRAKNPWRESYCTFCRGGGQPPRPGSRHANRLCQDGNSIRPSAVAGYPSLVCILHTVSGACTPNGLVMTCLLAVQKSPQRTRPSFISRLPSSG